MHDEFLHHLRKEPRPEFTARLRSRLRRQTMSHRPRVPPRVRTLLTLLLLGGTAFAVTSVVMRGVPRLVIELWQLTVARTGAGHTTASTHRAGNEGFLAGLRWGASWASPPHSGSPRSAPTHAAALAASVPVPPAAAGAASSSSAPVGGALVVPRGSRVKVMASWAAYPYVQALAERLGASRIDVSAGDHALWRKWPQAMCSGKPGDPDIALAYTFERVGTVGSHPCPDLPNQNPVIAIPLGYEAVVLARSPLYGALNLTRREAYLVLAKWVPDPARPGTVYENGATQWQQIDGALGPEPIQLIGPPLSSDTGRSMIELLMEAGCDTYAWIAALKSTAPDKYARICRTVRTDGVYNEDADPLTSGLLQEPNALGIFGFGDLTNPGTHLAVSRLDGVTPTPQDIASGTYPASRGVYLYINRWRAPPPVMFGFLHDDLLSANPDGLLVPLPDAQRQASFTAALGR